MDRTLDSETSFIVTPEASSTHYMSVVSGLETSVQKLDSSLVAVELAVQELRKSGKRTRLWQVFFCATLFLLLASGVASLWFIVDLKAEVHIMNKVRIGNRLEESSDLTGKFSMTAGLESLVLQDVSPTESKLTTVSIPKRRFYVPPSSQ